jgi:hypothetical protein
MKRFVIWAIILVVGFPALAQDSRGTPSPSHGAPKVQRDITLEQEVFARARGLASLLQPGARAKLENATRGLLARLASGPESVDPYDLAQQEVRSRFTRVSNEQSDLLCFYVLAEVARILTVPDELKGKLGSENELSEMTSLRLQMMMDRRSKYISTLSNIMKKIDTTQETLIQNIK